MSSAVDQLVVDHVGRDIIIVAHFGVILSQVQRATSMPAKSVLAFKIDNLSVTCIEHLNPAWRVLGVNHLP
jgi:broad specificity phosphatase PhoE